MATIGLRDVHFALLIEDPVEGVAIYDAPMRVAGAITANINPNSSTATLFSDDGPSDTASSMGDIELELNMRDIPSEIQAIWLGHEYNDGILTKRGGDSPVWIALGFRSLKSNGQYRHIWLSKGKFALPEEEYETRGESVEFSTPTISGSFVKRDCDDIWEITADSDDPQVGSDTIGKWFEEGPLVPTGGGPIIPDPIAVTVSAEKYTLEVGDTVKASARVTPPQAKQDVEWSSLSEAIASVSSDGTITAAKPGNVTIRATTTGDVVQRGNRTFTVREKATGAAASLEAKVDEGFPKSPTGPKGATSDKSKDPK